MATDFSSLDKLMEFGLGLGIATQMMNTMNSIIARTAMPGVGINPGISIQPEMVNNTHIPRQEFYVVYEERVAGPFSETEMSKLIKERKVNRQTFCWKQGSKAWTFAENIPEINKLLLLYS